MSCVMTQIFMLLYNKGIGVNTNIRLVSNIRIFIVDIIIITE